MTTTLLSTRALITSKQHRQPDKFETAGFELHALLGQPSLVGVPLLVVRDSDMCHILMSSLPLAG
jgi:hypothetical protein